MKSLIKKLFPQGSFLPVVVDRCEAFFLRLGLSIVVLISVWAPSKYDRIEVPAGIATWGIDMSFLGRDGVHPWFLAFMGLSALIYLLGMWRGTLVTLLGILGLTIGHLLLWTLKNCQGNTFHGSNMTTMVLLWQAGAAAIQLYREKKAIPATPRWTNLDGMLLYFAQCAIAGSYVASAITKLGKSGGRWVLDSHLFGKSVQKVWRQHYYDDPSNTAYAGISPWAQWIVENPLLARFMFAPGFFLELFAFLILCNRRWALFLGVSIVAMHYFIQIIMQLEFPEFQMLVTVFAINIPFWAWWLKNRHSQSQLAVPVES
jgi:uncharacterized membrane protein (UPF0136 family)